MSNEDYDGFPSLGTLYCAELELALPEALLE